jgi:hypothetical protein
VVCGCRSIYSGLWLDAEAFALVSFVGKVAPAMKDSALMPRACRPCCILIPGHPGGGGGGGLPTAQTKHTFLAAKHEGDVQYIQYIYYRYS